jgi:transketolase
MSVQFGTRRGEWLDVGETACEGLAPWEKDARERFDLAYRTLCAILYNYAPTSGHPGGSISSGRFVASALFGAMAYDLSDPRRPDSDLISYAAGHKALGLYAMWALRDEVARLAAPELLPDDFGLRLRLEDLLGFRRNPSNQTPLFVELGSKPLDGHPTPATPFVPLATGASGVGMASSLGLALAAADRFGRGAPRVHIIEGEGGLTPGRVSEALAFAGTASLDNVIVHLDWNQSSIDSDRVCREDGLPGDYVQWTPAELFYLHDWNVVEVPDGTDLAQIRAAQRLALELENGQPTAIVYRTTKGWRYGIEGRKSHGAGHKLCSGAFYEVLAPLLGSESAEAPGAGANFGVEPVEAVGVEPWEIVSAGVPRCDPGESVCALGGDRAQVERCYWTALLHVRRVLAENPEMTGFLAGGLREARRRLDALDRAPREGGPEVAELYRAAASGASGAAEPRDVAVEPGTALPLRKQLGRVLGYLNRQSRGALLIGAADLLDSTAVSLGAEGFPDGYFNRRTNPGSRVLSVGGIAEDALAGVLSGVASFGAHLGAGASYGAFIAPLGHIASRLHAIGQQARAAADGRPYRPFFLVCGHAGLKTGEDGPTHADPQALQLLQENFPPGTMVTLTPWEPGEIWTLVAAGLSSRPAVLAPFVTRPAEPVLDREALGLAPASAAARGLYRLRAARGEPDGTVVLQGSGVTYAFVRETLPLLEAEGIDLDVFHVSSAELFDLLPAGERDAVYPAARAAEAMGITGFTKATMYRWVTSEMGRRHTLHPFRAGHFLGSGPGPEVIHEAGLDGEGQLRAIEAYLNERARRPAGVGG